MKRREWTRGMAGALTLSLLLTACSGGEEAPGDNGGDETGAGEKTTITIAVTEKDPIGWLDQAEQAYEALHPDTDVVIEEYIATPKEGDQMAFSLEGNRNPADLEKYRAAINTELMSGAGADVIAVRDLDVDRYVEKGLFADLGERMAESGLLAEEDYFINVFDAAKTDGKPFVLPVQFSIKAITTGMDAAAQAGDDANWSWRELLDAGKALVDQAPGENLAVMAGIDPLTLLTSIVQAEYGTYIDETGKQVYFDSEPFRELLTTIRTMFETGTVSEPYDALIEGRDVFRADTLYSASQLVETMQSGRQLLRMPGDGAEEGVVFASNMVFALNEKSQVKPEAWDFLLFLLSEEMQANPAMFMSFPLNKAALEHQLENAILAPAQGKKESDGAFGGTSAMEKAALSQDQKEEIFRLASQPGRFYNSDPRLMQMMQEEAAPYFAGEKTAEAVTKAMQSRAQTYLNE
ncbi:extracellular solute-binding protein [Paenibacillus sp. IB182496]|uniref:Extracellular solute-binding protein n=1 Tax=Paenibacillus sabuli TaxID=2772509 RepID=A0A927BRI3_9BACL|nr:extracellular solute-binding protein [Paenibacillus sabuli]MBD2845427.1 extracellular solute-binding protein [Paenibacillus sabuli]